MKIGKLIEAGNSGVLYKVKKVYSYSDALC